MTKKSAAEILRQSAEDLDRLGFALATRCRFDEAVRQFMHAEECRRTALVTEQFDRLRRRE